MKWTKRLCIVAAAFILAGCGETDPINTSETYGGLPQRALTYNPKASAINTQLGVGYLQQGQMERAKMKLLLALKQDPNSSDGNGAMAYYYDRIGNAKEAEKYYRKAYELASSKGGASNNYGVFLCKHNRFKEADKYFKQAINDPQYIKTAEVYENMGLCALDVQQTAEAEEYFKQALVINNQLSDALFEMAKLEYGKGKYLEAEQYLRRYNSVTQPTPRSLWLDIQVAEKIGNKDLVASNALLLKHKYPKSKEYQEYKAAYKT